MIQPTVFDHYRVCPDETGKPRELGRGAMGVTYLADDSNLQRKVALKVIDAASLDDAQRNSFAEEARAAAMLRHHNVATVHHLGANRTHFFYAMEYVHGETAEAWIAEHGPMPATTALSIALQVARALAAAARHGVIHRDVKPSNLMLCTDADGEWPTVKMIDFGLATVAEADPGTPAGGFHGTAQYSSPEQALQEQVDARSDVYSLGCVLWFLLTGAPPFTGSLASVFAQHFNSEPPFKKLPRLPKSVRLLLGQMLAKKREQRPEPQVVADALQSCLGALERKGGVFGHRLARPVAALAPQRPKSKAPVDKQPVGRRFAALVAAGNSWSLLRRKASPLATAAVVIVGSTLFAVGFLVTSFALQNSENTVTSAVAEEPSSPPSDAPDDVAQTEAAPAIAEAAPSVPPAPATESTVAETAAPPEPVGVQDDRTYAQANNDAPEVEPQTQASAPTAEPPPAQNPVANSNTQPARQQAASAMRGITAQSAPPPKEIARRLPKNAVLASFAGVDSKGRWTVAVPKNSTRAQTARTINARKKDLAAKEAAKQKESRSPSKASKKATSRDARPKSQRSTAQTKTR